VFDQRQLGIAMSRLTHVGSGLTAGERVGNRFPWLRRNPKDFSFLDSYDVVLANSAYTQDWIRRLWGVESEVLFPPIEVERIVASPTREQRILSVGRFFAPGYGHSKRQLEMVEMFGRLVRSGQIDGWRLAVVGGCEDTQRPYLDKVRAAAAGLPVDIHPNAPRSLVESLMSSSAIFWSATGFKEDTEKRPWTNEHFGMTTAEAMAGGCVPVVIDRAGQREIVRQGVDGFRWSDESELRIRTVQVAHDPDLRARMSDSAQQRVRQFSEEAFAHRWKELADSYDLLS
jgi:glycosyltransferase involved in cell wall biosynthesis